MSLSLLKFSFKINVVNLYYHFTLPGRGLTKHWLAATASLCSLIASAQPTLALHWHWSGVTWSKLILFKFLINIFKCNAMQVSRLLSKWEFSVIYLDFFNIYIYLHYNFCSGCVACVQHGLAWKQNFGGGKREQLPAVCPGSIYSL